MNVWKLIERDHENIGQLIHETPMALNGPGVVRSRERLLGDLIGELEAHAAAVDASLYAPLSRHTRTRKLVEELHREHHQFMRQLGALARTRSGDSTGWLDTFEDVTFLVDQHLHRHKHELVPAAQALLGPEETWQATRQFIRAKMRTLRSRRSVLGGFGMSDLTLTAMICAAAAGLGLLAWQSGRLRGVQGRSSRRGGRVSSSGTSERGQSKAALAAATAPGRRRPDEDLHQRQRQERLLDEAVEETFPASDPISPQRFTR